MAVTVFGDTLIDDAREGTIKFFEHYRSKYGSRLQVVAGFDANVTLPGNVLGVTGSGVREPLRSHNPSMQHQIVSWMEALGIRALNTYNGEAAHSELWTCGLRRKEKARSQIDFVAVSDGLDGVGKSVKFFDIKSESALWERMETIGPCWPQFAGSRGRG